MSKVLISIALLVVVCTAQLSVNLTPTPIIDGTSKKTTNFVYTFKGDDKKNVLFSTLETGDLYNSADPTAKSLEIQLGNSQDDRTGKLNFNGKVVDPAVKGQVDYTIGLQIPVEGQAYLSSRISSKFRLQSQSFSFLFNEKVNKIFFGQPQSYLTEKLLAFPVYHVAPTTSQVPANQWNLEVSQVYLSKQNQQLNSGAPGAYAAQFDSTTAVITVDPETYTKVFTGLNIVLDGNTVTSDCTSNLNSNDDALVFVFKGNDDTKNNKFSVKTRDLFIKQEDGKCVFLLQKTAAVAKGALATWTLGTTFLKNVYTYFDYTNYQISLGNIQALKIQNKNINQTWSTVFIIVGVLLAIASLAILTALIKPITWVPEAPKQKVQPQPQVVPQKVIIYQQPAQQVVYTQPLGYSNIAQSLSGGSPTRVYQQAPFQSVYRQ